jgi:hypothetical protein
LIDSPSERAKTGGFAAHMTPRDSSTPDHSRNVMRRLTLSICALVLTATLAGQEPANQGASN